MTLEKEEIEVKCLKVYGGTDFFFHFGITYHWVLIMIIQHPWISGSSLCINHKTTFSAFAGWDRCGRRWSDQLWRVLHHDVHKVLRGHKGLQGKVGSGEASRSAKQSLFHLNTLQCPGYVLHSMKWTYLCIHKVRANPQQTSLFGDADVEDFVLKNSLGWKHGWTFDLLR